MKKRFTRIMAAMMLLVTLAIPMGMRGQTYEEVLTLDCASASDQGTQQLYGTNGTTTMTVAGIKTYLKVAAGATNDIVSGDVTKTGDVYWQKGSGGNGIPDDVLKLGKASGPGGIAFELVDTYDQIQKVSITGYGWKTTTKVAVNGSATQSPSTALTEVTFDYVLSSATRSLSIQVTTSAFCVTEIKLYKEATGGNPTCATPTFNPAAGTYTQAQNVTISCATEGATIYYTTNGDEPTANSTVYANPISVSSNMTIKAMAAAQGYDNSAVATASYTIMNIEHAGTEADPYTVADARAAIDANAGTQGVYATGIVSDIPTAWSTQFNNITFNFVDNSGDTDFLQAFRCVSGTGVDASTVAVGDIVVVHGNLTKYGSTYEFEQGCELVSLTHPTHPIIIANDINLAYDATSGSIAYSISNPTSATLTATSTADWISNITVNAESVTFTTTANESDADRTATITLSYTGADDKVITVTQAHYVPDYATLPFAFNDGRDAIAETNGLTQSGLDTDYADQNTKLKFNGTDDYVILKINERPGTLTFNIKGNSFSSGTFTVQTSEDGVTYTDLKTYTELGDTQSEEFTNLGENVRYIKWIYTEKVSGNVGLGNIALAKYVAPTTYNLTVSLSSNITGIFVYDDPSSNPLIANGAAGTVQVYNGTSITVRPDIADGYVLETLIVDGNNVTSQVADGAYSFTMPTHAVIISATASVAPVVTSSTYTLATTIESGKQYIIVGWANSIPYAMGYDKGNNRHAVEITVTGENDENASATIANTETNVHEFTITSLGEGYYSIMDATTSGGYLYAASNGSNHLRTEAELDANHNGEWKITFDAESGSASVVASQSQNRNVMQFNNSSTLFACYATASQHPVFLYEKVEYTLTVPGYGNSAGGYHLIASPIMETVLPTAVTNMIDATPANYDLYRFNQDEDYEWQNYKRHTDGFVIEPGKAYLYAHNTDVTLIFNGTAYNGNGTFNLTQSATNNTSNGGKMNAVGNPYNATASIGDRSFYKMNADGTALKAVVGETIGALEGIVVNYDANNPTVTFSTSKSRDVIELLTLNLQEQDNVIDNVIVRFDGGDQLLKYQIFDSSKIYVTVDGEDYAVVRGENQGTLPVNFVALSNGTYTISMDFENMTFSYLHLIDNLTGEDIDMLTTTSYSFDATTEDDANRFTLVYSKDGEDTTETLTFYDGDTSSSYVPVYGFYADAYQKVEFIMPTDDLSELNGGTINKMTWYLTTPAEAAWGGNFKIYLMETEATTPENYADLTNATLVYDGPLDGTGETLEINFATGFLYEGDNLLVAVHQTETGTYKSATFAGSAVTGAALQGYNYSSLDQVNQNVRDFLPKTTFEFTPSSGAVYYKPKQLQASEIGLTSAVLTWVAGDDETSWGVEYKKVTEDTWTDAGTVDQLTITLDNLEAGTEYEAHVKSIYTDGESGWTTIAFATEACEETDKGEVAYSLTDTYGDGWNNNKLRIFLSGTDIMIAELTLTTGSELEGVVKLCYDTDYDLVWVAGNYAYETGFVLTAPDGTIIYEYHGTGSSSGGTTPTPGVLTTFQIHNGFTKTIKAYTDNSGYYLIASPVGNVLASNVTNMVDGNYDLYMFDQTGDDEGKQWLNYKASAFSYLEVGLGYLYASESDVTLTFSGTPISSNDDYAVEVNYNASSDFPGLNLLGNPFAEEAYLVNAEGNGLAYHRLNPANNTYVTVDDNSAIPMMEGVFYEAGENDVVVYFSATAPATSKSNLNITVSQGRGMVDNAIVRFGEGNTLRKISLRDNSTKVYIPQNGSEYALVNANEFGEMPVNFKAESNGTYTMSFSNQNVEFGYLHLIDNLTGTDVDLLANPSYSFEAKVSDYASRFKLVFATGNDDSSSDFAFVSNDEIIVNGEGMLQVIDMTGRIISTSQVNGMSSIKLNAASGVYVLRLNDKTQKIVIR